MFGLIYLYYKKMYVYISRSISRLPGASLCRLCSSFIFLNIPASCCGAFEPAVSAGVVGRGGADGANSGGIVIEGGGAGGFDSGSGGADGANSSGDIVDDGSVLGLCPHPLAHTHTSATGIDTSHTRLVHISAKSSRDTSRPHGAEQTRAIRNVAVRKRATVSWIGR